MVEEVRDATAKAIMFRIADDYDRLAVHANQNTALALEATVAWSREAANLANPVTITVAAEPVDEISGLSSESSNVETRDGCSITLDQNTIDRLTIIELSQSLSDVISASKQRRQ